MRFEVPQFIEVEDKIVGPFTWKQFVYLAGGAGALVILYLLVPFMVFVLIGLPIGALAGFLAFHRINNRPFSIFLESFVNYISHSRLYLWRKAEQQEIIIHAEPEISLCDPVAQTQRKTLNSLSRKLDMNSLQR